MDTHTESIRDDLMELSAQYTMLLVAIVQAGAAPRVIATMDELAKSIGGRALPEARHQLALLAGTLNPEGLDWTGVFDKIEARREGTGAAAR